MDELDHELIRQLQKNARQSSGKLSCKLNTSASNVRRRIKKLLEEQYIRIIAVVNAEKVGLPLTSIISINTDKSKLDNISETLAQYEEVKWISLTTGRYDIVFGARFPSTDALSEFVQHRLSSIEGVKDSETAIILNQKRGRYGPV